MTTAELKLGLFLPSWSGALDGATPSARDVVDIAPDCGVGVLSGTMRVRLRTDHCACAELSCWRPCSLR